MRKLRQAHKFNMLILRMGILSLAMFLMGAIPTIVGERSPLSFSKVAGGLPVIQDHSVFTGNVFYVVTGGTDTAGFGKHPDRPFATIDFAIGQCTASQGDVIFPMPGHTETISAAAGIACDVAGVSIIGLGHGAARPTVTFSATGSTWTITAANVLIKNIIVTATAATTKMFDSSAVGLTLDGVDYVEGSAIPLQFLLTTSSSDNLIVQNCYHNAKTAGASAQLWIRLIGNDSPQIVDNVFMLTLENGATDAAISGDASVRSFVVARNIIVQLGGTTQVSAILFADGATGLAVDNRAACNTGGSPAAIVDVGTSGYGAENYALDTADKSGLLSPVVDT